MAKNRHVVVLSGENKCVLWPYDELKKEPVTLLEMNSAAIAEFPGIDFGNLAILREPCGFILRTSSEYRESISCKK